MFLIFTLQWSFFNFVALMIKLILTISTRFSTYIDRLGAMIFCGQRLWDIDVWFTYRGGETLAFKLIIYLKGENSLERGEGTSKLMIMRTCGQCCWNPTLNCLEVSVMGLHGVALKVGFPVPIVQAKEIGLCYGRDLPTFCWLSTFIFGWGVKYMRENGYALLTTK